MRDWLMVVCMAIGVFALWALLGCLFWLGLGGFGILLLAKVKMECENRRDLVLAILCKSSALSAIVFLSCKYGWLGPLLSAIVRAFKNA